LREWEEEGGVSTAGKRSRKGERRRQRVVGGRGRAGCQRSKILGSAVNFDVHVMVIC